MPYSSRYAVGDTIAAIATPFGEGGISVVKVSGPEAVRLAEGLLRSRRRLSEVPPRHMLHAWAIDPSSGEPLDEVLAVRFDPPRSYTGEEVAEIHCHGGCAVSQRILEILLQLGARHASPGEFTFRAFFNGKMDLTQVESVLSLIRARTEAALKSAARSLGGAVRRRAESARERLLRLAAWIEAQIDYPDEDVPQAEVEALASELEGICEDLEDLLERMRAGQLLGEGIRVAIVGRPNVGKSSLLNALLKEARAIVTSIPGTTRDIVEGVISHKGIPIRLADTAGIRETIDEVESIGVQRALAAARESDVNVLVLDGSDDLTEEDLRLMEEFAHKPMVVVVNKLDLPSRITPEGVRREALRRLGRDLRAEVLEISALRGTNVEALKEALVRFVLEGEGGLQEALSSTPRQISCVLDSSEHLKEAKLALDEGLGLEVVAELIRRSLEKLDVLLGLSAQEDVIEQIFSSFCVGK